ncbi:MAG: ABC transporter permease [Deinococcota bacterium]
MFTKLQTRYQTWQAANSDVAALPWLLGAVLLLMTVLTRGRFLGSSNIINLLSQMPELGLLSLAMMVAMITAGIDLSIISAANLSAVVMALVLTQLVPEGASSTTVWGFVVLAIITGLLTSAFLGAINGYLIGYVEVPAVLATLGTMILYEGVTLAITRGFVISGLPSQFLLLGNARILGIPIQMLIFAVVAVVIGLLLQKRPYGVYLYFVGSNPTATAFSGVNVRRVLLRTYITSGLLSGIAAIVMLARFNSANARQGSSLLLLTVLICMLGGTDPYGGFGRVSGLVLALVILQMVTSGLNLLGVNSFAAVALWGAMLVGVIIYKFVQRRRWERQGKQQLS